MRITTTAVLVVLLSLVGCRSTDLAAPIDVAGSNRVPGKPRVAYLRVPKALREAGVSGGGLGASFDESGEGMTVRSATPDGRKFVLHFRPDGPDASSVAVVWDGPPDDALTRKIVAGLYRD